MPNQPENNLLDIPYVRGMTPTRTDFLKAFTARVRTIEPFVQNKKSFQSSLLPFLTADNVHWSGHSILPARSLIYFFGFSTSYFSEIVSHPDSVPLFWYLSHPYAKNSHLLFPFRPVLFFLSFSCIFSQGGKGKGGGITLQLPPPLFCMGVLNYVRWTDVTDRWEKCY